MINYTNYPLFHVFFMFSFIESIKHWNTVCLFLHLIVPWRESAPNRVYLKEQSTARRHLHTKNIHTECLFFHTEYCIMQFIFTIVLPCLWYNYAQHIQHFSIEPLEQSNKCQFISQLFITHLIPRGYSYPTLQNAVGLVMVPGII